MVLLLFPYNPLLILDMAQADTLVKLLEAIVPVLSRRHERLVSAAFDRDARHHFNICVISETENYQGWGGNKATRSSISLALSLGIK